MKHPIQPLEEDENGTIRFKKNAVVEYLLENGGLDMNDLARQNFSDNDREQFAQLIGYSLSGFGELSYVSNDTYDTAERMAESGETQEQAQIKVLSELLSEVREKLGSLVPLLFKIHPDDLTS